MKVKIKKLNPLAVIPKYSKPGDAGMDLHAVSLDLAVNSDGKVVKIIIDSGLAFEIPKGFVGLVFPRSSVHSSGVRLANSVGVIDSGYRGPVKAVFDVKPDETYMYNVGDRFAQIMILPYPDVEFEEVEELSSTERGEGGFGSTGVS